MRGTWYLPEAGFVRALVVTAALLCGCVVEPPADAPPTSTPHSAAGDRNAEGARRATNGAGNANAGGDAPGPRGPSSAAAGPKLRSHTDALAEGLVPEARLALDRVEGEARRLLALRGYLRAGREAAVRWAWSQDEVERYEQSPEYAAALAEVEKVRRKFAELNPGYSLRVNTKVRSLDEQLRNWNEAASVGRAGEELLSAAAKEIEGATYGEAVGADGLRRFERFLRDFRPRETPTVAVPGLSPHGRSRAFDFQVVRGDELIAGTSGAGAWDRAGWTGRLQEAVRDAGAGFAGPLASPREPWHYEYRP